LFAHKDSLRAALANCVIRFGEDTVSPTTANRRAIAPRRKAGKERRGGRLPAKLNGSLVKASEALLDLAEPLMSDDDDRQARQDCLSFAIIAWNLSLLPARERRRQMGVLFDAVQAQELEFDSEDEEDADNIQNALNELVLRKQPLYPKDHRFFVDVDVLETENGYNVRVASMLATA
jgi:hypothetical protein